MHFGSLVAALGSWLDARAAHGRWLVRIEDLDTPREQPGAARQILSVLEACELHWDGEVVFQSRRSELYGAALARLSARRATIRAAARARKWPTPRRPSMARACIRAPAAADSPRKDCQGSARAYGGRAVAFEDRLFGRLAQSVEREVGDFVLWRADALLPTSSQWWWTTRRRASPTWCVVRT